MAKYCNSTAGLVQIIPRNTMRITMQEDRKAKEQVLNIIDANAEKVLEAFEDDGSEDLTYLWCNELISNSEPQENSTFARAYLCLKK